MQFLVTAFDGTDADALDRRMAVRDAHIEGAKLMKETGTMRAGGAILDDDGKMIGSAMILDFPSRTELDAWLAADPYTTGDVWRTVEVRPFRLAT